MTNQAGNRFQQVITLVRANDWWAYKLAPVLGTAYGTAAILNIPLIRLWPSLLFVLIALVIGASYASVINNVCDQQEDQISAKSNYFLGRSNLFIALILTACIVPGFIISALLISNPLAFGVYLTNWLIFTAYSLPPMRLKKHGFLGTMADAMGANVLPQMFAVFVVVYDADKTLPAIWLLFIAIWSLTSGLRGIFWHQILDFDNDSRAGVYTFAIQTSPQTLENLGKWIIFPAEVVALVGIFVLSKHILVWAFLGLYLITEWLRYYFWQITPVMIEPADNKRILIFEYYDVFYPLGFLCLAIWKHPLDLIILGVHLSLYYQRLWWWMRDIWGLLRWEIPAKIKQDLLW